MPLPDMLIVHLEMILDIPWPDPPARPMASSTSLSRKLPGQEQCNKATPLMSEHLH